MKFSHRDHRYWFFCTFLIFTYKRQTINSALEQSRSFSANSFSTRNTRSRLNSIPRAPKDESVVKRIECRLQFRKEIRFRMYICKWSKSIFRLHNAANRNQLQFVADASTGVRRMLIGTGANVYQDWSGAYIKVRRVLSGRTSASHHTVACFNRFNLLLNCFINRHG